MEKKSFTISLS